MNVRNPPASSESQYRVTPPQPPQNVQTHTDIIGDVPSGESKVSDIFLNGLPLSFP